MDIAGVDVEIDVIRELPELEDLIVNPSTEDQNFNSSKYGFKSVKINAIKGDKLDLDPSLEQQNLKGVFTEVNINPIQTKKLNATPTTQEQVISGLFDEVTVNAIEGQELNLNPSEEQQNYEGVFLGVNIKPIQVEEITTDLDFSSGDAIELTAQEGAYIKKTTINKPSNLSPENIKSGETVCGIAGTYIPLDTSDATATAEDVLKDKTFYANGQRYVGTLEAGGDNNALLDASGATSLNVGKCLVSITSLDTSSVTSMSSSFSNYVNLTSIPELNTSNVTNMNYTFNGCSALQTIPLIDTSKVTSMTNMFYGCSALQTIPALDTSSVTNMQYMFANCGSLHTVPVFDMSKVTNVYYMFQNCYALSNDSLNNIMQMCISATSMTSNKTLNYIGLSSSQITKCKSLSNYQAFLDAGWTA